MSGEGLTTDFPLVEKGYDPNQVDEYLAEQMLQLREEAEAARNRITELERQVGLAKEAEEGLRMTLVLAKRAAEEMTANAKVEADEIVSEARREAFILMTEARSDADTSVGEGQAAIAAARDEAMSVVADVETETARLIAERNAALAKLREDYEAESAELIDRINTLRSISGDLEHKSPAAPQAAAAPSSPSPTNEGGAANASQTEDVPDREEDSDAPSAAKIRESFSGRRSAKLPRIGEEAGRSALAAATAMRAHMTNEPEDSADSGDEDLAVRTA